MPTPACRKSFTVVLPMLVLACGSSLRTVPVGPHSSTRAALTVVDTAPPPAKIETIPEPPATECAWLDGRWEWTGSAWEWRPGTWVRLEGSFGACHYAVPEALWAPTSGTGLLFYLPGRWYRQDGTPCGEPPQCKRRGS